MPRWCENSSLVQDIPNPTGALKAKIKLATTYEIYCFPVMFSFLYIIYYFDFCDFEVKLLTSLADTYVLERYNMPRGFSNA